MNSLREINPICKVYFAGFESDTYTLQNNGWCISASQVPHRFTVSLALKHSGAGLYGLTNEVSMQDYVYHNRMSSMGSLGDHRPMFKVVCMSSRDVVNRLISTSVDFGSFSPVDAIPSFSEEENQSMAELVPFRELGSSSVEDLIIDPSEVGFWMDKIIEAQEPKQKERRDRILKERRMGELKPIHNVHAKIISLAS